MAARPATQSQEDQFESGGNDGLAICRLTLVWRSQIIA